MRSDERVRVALVSDAELIRCGLEGLLAPYSHRVQVVGANHEAGVGPVDVTLINIDVDTPAGRVILNDAVCDPHAGVVVLYVWDIDAVAVDAPMAAGCRGRISTRLNGEDLALALEQIVAAAPPEEHLFGVLRGELEGWIGRHAGLTIRESEVLQLVGQGLTNSEIGDELYLSVNTIKYYIRTAYRKIGAERRPEAVRWIIEQQQGTRHYALTL